MTLLRPFAALFRRPQPDPEPEIGYLYAETPPPSQHQWDREPSPAHRQRYARIEGAARQVRMFLLPVQRDAAADPAMSRRIEMMLDVAEKVMADARAQQERTR